MLSQASTATAPPPAPERPRRSSLLAHLACATVSDCPIILYQEAEWVGKAKSLNHENFDLD